MKADYLKKIQQQGALINLEGPRMNEPPYVFDENVISLEPNNRCCEEKNRNG